MYMSLFSTCGWILRLGVTVALLISIHPALILLAAFALPTVLTSTWRPAVERAVQERVARYSRLAQELRARMEAASAEMHYEEAAGLHELIRTVEEMGERQKMAAADGADTDIFAYHAEPPLVALNLFFYGWAIGRRWAKLRGSGP